MENDMRRFAEMSTTRKKGVSGLCIQETELALENTFDEQYKELVKIVNAPEYGEWRFYPIKDKENLKKTFDDVIRNTKLEREAGLPSEFIAIAENGTGNFLCMKSGEQSVYHKDHEYELPEQIFSDLKEFIQQAEEFES